MGNRDVGIPAVCVLALPEAFGAEPSRFAPQPDLSHLCQARLELYEHVLDSFGFLSI